MFNFHAKMCANTSVYFVKTCPFFRNGMPKRGLYNKGTGLFGDQRFLWGSSSRGGQYCLLMQLLRTYVYFFFLEHKSQFPVVEGSAAPTTDTPPSYKLCTKSTSDSSVRTFKSPLRTKKNHRINQSARSRRVE